MSDQVKMTAMNYAPDRPKAENPVKVMDLSFRDGHQSLFATRGRTEDMIPVAEMMDEIGFWALETWGGATFDTMHRFLNEDPWERLRTLKRYIKKTPFSMLLRAQNLVGYRNYADDTAIAFVERAAENGMDVFRTFDALNDYRNFETVVKGIKKAGKHFQGCICYSLTEPRLGGDVYDLKYYVDRAKALDDMGADSICIKDMAGLIAPYDAYAIVKAIKEVSKTPVHLHSHFTSGMASMSHLKAIEAGVDIIDTCMTPYAFRTAHPAIEPLVISSARHQPRHRFRHQEAGRDQRGARERGYAQVQAPDGRLQGVHHRHQRTAAPDPGRHAVQPGQPTARDGRAGQDRSGVQGAAAGSQGSRPDPAGHPDPARSSASRP